MNKKWQGIFEKSWPKIIAKAWSDKEFKKRLLNNPHEVLKEYGIDVPLHFKIEIHENEKESFHLTLPNKTEEGLLSEEELKAVQAARGFSEGQKWGGPPELS